MFPYNRKEDYEKILPCAIWSEKPTFTLMISWCHYLLSKAKNVKEEIPSMPQTFRMSLDEIEKEVRSLWSMGLKGVLVFAKVSDVLKDNAGTEALNPQGLMQRAIQTIKNAVPEMVVFSDVALDPLFLFRTRRDCGK
jgi:delta-aminolevulinic acid dehydratase/porphobilinogen synthase